MGSRQMEQGSARPALGMRTTGNLSADYGGSALLIRRTAINYDGWAELRHRQARLSLQISSE